MKQEKINTIIGCILSIISFALFSSMIRLTFENPTGLNIFFLCISIFFLSRSGVFYINNLSKWGNTSPTKTSKKAKPIILDNNELSLAAYAEEYPENWKKICDSQKEQITQKTIYDTKEEAERNKRKQDAIYFVAGKGYYVVRKKISQNTVSTTGDGK